MTGAVSLRLVLASGSPRRRNMLAALGLDVVCVPADVDEARRDGEAPAALALRAAREKAAAVAAGESRGPVVGADTIVVLGDEILGKPAGRDDGRRMLRRLSGCTHVVLTAVSVAWQGRTSDHLESARVTFARLPDELVEWYLATGEGDDKAGGYALQGSAGLFIERIEGNVQAVIGLPLSPLPGLLARVGVRLIRHGAKLRLSPSRRAGA